jgi:hypothetical protein
MFLRYPLASGHRGSTPEAGSLGRTESGIMVTRLRYGLLFTGALLAISIGLWPSWLTLGAVIALPLALIALAGLLNPAFVDRHRGLRRFAGVGGGIIGLELVLLYAIVAWTPRRPVLLTAHEPVPQRVRVVYNVVDGEPREWWRWGRRHMVPATGVVYSEYPMDQGWYRRDNPHPVQAIVTTGTGSNHPSPAAWASGGTTEAGGCTLQYNEYILGDHRQLTDRRAESDSRGAWLDSLSTWGVECRRGRLYRLQPGEISVLRRTGPACYYGRSGGMTCAIPATAP